MKKSLFIAVFLATLSFPFTGEIAHAQTVDTNTQILELKTELISLLTQLISALQAQLNTLTTIQQGQQSQSVTSQTPNQTTTQTTNTSVSGSSDTSQAVTLNYLGAPSNSCHSQEDQTNKITTWNCTLSESALNGNVFINTSDNPAVTNNSFSITKDGTAYVGDLSGISTTVAPSGQWISELGGAKLSQNDSGGISLTTTVNESSFPAGSYTVTLNSVNWYTWIGNPTGTAQTMLTTDNPSFNFVVQ